MQVVTQHKHFNQLQFIKFASTFKEEENIHHTGCFGSPPTFILLIQHNTVEHDYPFETGSSTNFTRSYITRLHFLLPRSVIYCNMLAIFLLFFPTYFSSKTLLKLYLPFIIPSQTWIKASFSFCYNIIIDHFLLLYLGESKMFTVLFGRKGPGCVNVP